jgi:hypothetical protein
MEESTVAEEEAGMARSVKRARRLGAEHDPRSRIKFLTEPQSDPCVVCRYRHAEEYRQHLDREVAKAWNPPAYSAEGLYIGDEFEVEPPNPNSEDGSQITEDSPWGNGYNENYEITTTDDSNNTSEDGTSSNSVVSDEGLDLSSEDDDEKEGLADHSECYKLGYPCLCGGGDDVDHLQCWKVGAPCGCEL